MRLSWSLRIVVALYLSLCACVGARPPARAADHSTTSILLLGTANDGVYRSSAGGATWQPASAGLPPGGVWQLQDDPNHLATAYLTTGSVFRTTDAGATWQQIGGFPPDGPGVTALAFNGAALLAASTHGLVAASSKAPPIAQSPPVPGGAPRQIVPVGQHLLYALGADGSLYAHGDAPWLHGGPFWQPLHGGLPSAPITAFTYVAGTAGPQSMCPLNTCVVLFAGVEDHGLWKSLDSGQTWHQETDHPTLPRTTTIRAVLSTNLYTMYAAVEGAGLFHSVHSGQFWYPAARDPHYTYTALVQNGSTIIAATLGHGVQLFTVHGAIVTWQQQATGLPATVQGISLVRVEVPAPAPARVARLPGGCSMKNSVPLCDPFRHYYNAVHPSVVVFGNPLAPATYDRRNPTLIVQWFERARFEYRPDLPDQVRLTPLGTLLLGKRTFPKQSPAPGARYFPQTGFSLSGRFLTFWQHHGGARVLGYPISPVLHEANGDGTNQVYTLQYLQYARLELHPELAGTSYSVELGLLGRQYLCQYYHESCQN